MQMAHIPGAKELDQEAEEPKVINQLLKMFQGLVGLPVQQAFALLEGQKYQIIAKHIIDSTLANTKKREYYTKFYTELLRKTQGENPRLRLELITQARKILEEGPMKVAVEMGRKAGVLYAWSSYLWWKEASPHDQKEVMETFLTKKDNISDLPDENVSRRLVTLWESLSDLEDKDKYFHIQQWLRKMTKEWSSKERWSFADWLATLVKRAEIVLAEKELPGDLRQAVELIKGNLYSVYTNLRTWVIDKDTVHQARRAEITEHGDRTLRGKGKISWKKELFKAAPEEFAGAVHWAHEQGITGVGKGGASVPILVLENMYDRDKGAFLEKRMDIENAFLENDFTKKGDDTIIHRDGSHANQVTTRVLGIAPDARCFVRPKNDYIIGARYKHDDDCKHIKIINASFSVADTTDNRERFIQNMLEMATGRVYVQAFGNEHRHPEKFLSYSKGIHSNPQFLEKAILVVSVDRTFGVSSFSNRPRDVWEVPEASMSIPVIDDSVKQMIMDNTVSALGSAVVGFTNPGEAEKSDGTSFAAPTVSGALALVEGMAQQADIDLSAQELKGILLNSARQEIFISEDNGRNGIYLLPTDTSESVISDLNRKAEEAHKAKKTGNVVYKRFDPAQYGRGLLDIGRMTLLAKIYLEKRTRKVQALNDEESWSEVMAKECLAEATIDFLALDKAKQNQAATLIQQAQRLRKAGKSLRGTTAEGRRLAKENPLQETEL